MGILSKFNDPNATKALEDELKSKVGITSNDQVNPLVADVLTEPESEKSKKNIQENQVTTRVEGKEDPKEESGTVTTQEPTEKIRQPSKGKEKNKEEETTKPTVSNVNKGEEEKPDLAEVISSDDLEALLESFKKTYKQSDKENRMIRLQKKSYKSVIKLKLDNISISEFINFAIQYTTKSPQYDRIIKFLKPK